MGHSGSVPARRDADDLHDVTLEPTGRAGRAAEDAGAEGTTSIPGTGSHEQSIVLPEGEYARFLVQRAADEAASRLSSQNIRWRAIAGGGVTLLALLGYANIDSIRKGLREFVADKATTIESRLSATIADSVDDHFTKNLDAIANKASADARVEMDEAIAESKRAIALLELQMVSRELSEGDRFTNAARDTALALIRQVGDSRELAAQPGFHLALEKVLLAFISADIEPFVDDIEIEIQRHGIETHNVNLQLLMHYGMRVAGAVEVRPDDLEKFERYEAQADRLKMREFALPFRLGYEFREAGHQRTPEIDKHFEEARYLTPQERLAFLSSIRTLETFDQDPRRNGKMVRTAQLFTALGEAYEEDLADLLEASNAPSPDVDLQELLQLLELPE